MIQFVRYTSSAVFFSTSRHLELELGLSPPPAYTRTQFVVGLAEDD